MKLILNAVAILATLGITIISINTASPTSHAIEFGNITLELFDMASKLPEILNFSHIQKTV